MACPPLQNTLTDITEILESSALDWMIDVKNNSGLMNNIEEIYPEDTIVSNNASSLVTMNLIPDEIFRVKTIFSTLYPEAVAARELVVQKLATLCSVQSTHNDNKTAWTNSRDNLDPEDPDYSNDYAFASGKISTNQTYYDNKQTQMTQLSAAADLIVEEIEAQFIGLAKGVLKTRYKINTTVGSLIDIPTDGSFDSTDVYYITRNSNTPTAYVLKALNKIGKWSEFSQSLEITTKLKTLNFTANVSNGTGSYSSVINALSARDAEFNSESELIVTSDMEYKPALIAAYGPEMITAIQLSKNMVDTEYAFMGNLLVSTVTDQTVTYNSAVNPSWISAGHTFQVPSWYADKNTELDVLQQSYNPYDDPYVPLTAYP
jgi:hypothetical protein